jgi:K+-transporting ATPase c subunit
MLNFIRTAVRTTLLTLLVTGLLYPLGMTLLAQLLFSSRAHGSLVTDEKGHVVGSALIGQRFVSPWYFQPRPRLRARWVTMQRRLLDQTWDQALRSCATGSSPT